MMRKFRLDLMAMGLALFGLGAGPVHAQIESIDPDTAYSANSDQWEDAGSSWEEESPYAEDDYSTSKQPQADSQTQTSGPDYYDYDSDPYAGSSASSGGSNAATPSDAGQAAAAEQWNDPYSPSGDMQDQADGTVDGGYYEASPSTRADVDQSETYKQDDLIGAAEGLFGKGAEGLAGMIETILAEQGEPNAYIVGREGGGALVFGLRYGSGTLFHKVEGQRDVYWTGPSVGFDAGAQAANTFVLVYNLYDSEELYNRFAAGEGAAYLVGGFTHFTGPVAKMLGFHEAHSNVLELGEGVLTGKVVGDIVDSARKAALLDTIAGDHGLSAAEVLAVGDGANDIPMIEKAGLGIAYHAKEKARAAADASINRSDLTALLYAQGIGPADWVVD